MIQIHCELGGSFKLSGTAESLYRSASLESLIGSRTDAARLAAMALCERDCERVEACLGVTRYSLPDGRVVAFYGQCARIERGRAS